MTIWKNTLLTTLLFATPTLAQQPADPAAPPDQQPAMAPVAPAEPAPPPPPAAAPAPIAPAARPAAPVPQSYAAASALPQPPAEEPEQSWDLALKAGVLLPGSVYVEVADQSFDTSTGPLLVASLDAMVARRLSLGAFLQHARPTVTILGDDYGAAITTFGGTIKGRFGQLDGIQFRPGLAIGYQIIASTGSSTTLEDVKGVDLGGLLEVSIPTGGAIRIPLELGFISQPAGGNSDTNVTFSPIFYLAGGVEFGG